MNRLVKKMLVILAVLIAGSCVNGAAPVSVDRGNAKPSANIDADASTSGSDKARAEKECRADRFAESYFIYRQQPENSELWKPVSCALAQLGGIDEAYRWQQQYSDYYAHRIEHHGYKVALGNKPAQALLGTPGPVIGHLFADMVLQSGAVISVQAAGKNIAVEADLLVTVASGAINSAKSIEDVARHLRSITAMLEVPDIMFPLKPDSNSAFIASNAGANLLVLGDGIDLALSSSAGPDAIDEQVMTTVRALATMNVRLQHGSEELSATPGSSLMGHPLNAVLYLVSELRARGQQLKAGDMISLGTFGKLVPVGSLLNPGASGDEKQLISVSYEGLVDEQSKQPIGVSAFFSN